MGKCLPWSRDRSRNDAARRSRSLPGRAVERPPFSEPKHAPSGRHTKSRVKRPIARAEVLSTQSTSLDACGAPRREQQ
eukprot:14323281-Alexandrium_andersonii.AAC.1